MAEAQHGEVFEGKQPEIDMPVFIHPTAEVSNAASIGSGTKVWNWVQIREHVTVGRDCTLSKGVYLDAGVTIGDLVKIQNNVSVFHGVTIQDGVFVGPHVAFTNDVFPRAVTPDFELATDDDWEVGDILVERGASIGANSTILPNVTIGEFALVGAGSVVTKDVLPYHVVVGNPARAIGIVDESAKIVARFDDDGELIPVDSTD